MAVTRHTAIKTMRSQKLRNLMFAGLEVVESVARDGRLEGIAKTFFGDGLDFIAITRRPTLTGGNEWAVIDS